MTVINRSALLPYSARQLFDLARGGINSKLLGVAASRLFDKVTNNLVDAVSRCATQLYG